LLVTIFEAMERVQKCYHLRVGQMIAQIYPGQSPYSLRDERLLEDLRRTFPFAFDEET
jgi:hypothetical protein